MIQQQNAPKKGLNEKSEIFRTFFIYYWFFRQLFLVAFVTKACLHLYISMKNMEKLPPNIKCVI
jgi:hypothetical protein